MQARDLRLAERVDRFGFQIERGELADLGVVIRLAVGQVVGGERCAYREDTRCA